MKYNIILNWECCLTVSFLQLHRVILLYEFFKETSIQSASQRKQSSLSWGIFKMPSLPGRLCFTNFYATHNSSTIFQNSQNFCFSLFCSKFRLSHGSSPPQRHCLLKYHVRCDFCLLHVHNFIVLGIGLGRVFSILCSFLF